jgi:hypothetical protein
VQDNGVAVRVACAAFGISEACYRYQAKHAAENAEIADHNKIRLTHNGNLPGKRRGPHLESGVGFRILYPSILP